MKGDLSISQAADRWGVSKRRVNQYCSQGRIPGAEKFGRSWTILDNAQKPTEPRSCKHMKKTPPKEE